MSYDKDFWDFAYEAFSAMRYTAIAVALTEKGELFDNSRLHTLQGLEWAVDTLKDNIIPYGEWSEDRDDTVLRLHRKTSGFIQGIIEIEVQNRLS